MHRATRRCGRKAAPLAQPVRATYRLLAMRGFGPAEAGNLTAYVNGIEPIEGGWSVREIERLLFLRHLSETYVLSG